MMRATCPTCSQTFTELAGLEAHVRRCRKPRSSTKRPSVVREEWAAIAPRPLPLRLRLDRSILSQNVFKGAHRWAYAKNATAWKQSLEVPLHTAGLCGLRLPYSRWTITRVLGPGERVFDFGNLVGGAKPVPDALVHFDVIQDDRPSCFSADYAQIRFTELPEDEQSTRTILTLISLNA